MTTQDIITKRFANLQQKMQLIRMVQGTANFEEWEEWATSVMNLLERAFGQGSAHFINFQKAYDNFQGYESDLGIARGIFKAVKEDYEGGHIFNLEASLSGELFGDFVALAKHSLSEGYKEVAAVLASAALEDALKRYAALNGVDVGDKTMQDVVSALRTRGLVGGAQKTLLDSMPKLRDYAMHANWDKLTPESVGSIIGFVEQFLVSHFS